MRSQDLLPSVTKFGSMVGVGGALEGSSDFRGKGGAEGVIGTTSFRSLHPNHIFCIYDMGVSIFIHDACCSFFTSQRWACSP